MKVSSSVFLWWGCEALIRYLIPVRTPLNHIIK